MNTGLRLSAIEYRPVVAENVDLVRRHYDAFNRHDLDGTLAVLADDIELVEEPGMRPDPAHFSGIEGARAFFEEMWELAYEAAVEPHEWIESKDKVIVPLRLSGRFSHTGIEAGIDIVHAWTVRDGRLSRIHVYATKEDALAAEGLDS
jgi:uncharacterized protein